jgi:hypothetical protein
MPFTVHHSHSAPPPQQFHPPQPSHSPSRPHHIGFSVSEQMAEQWQARQVAHLSSPSSFSPFGYSALPLTPPAPSSSVSATTGSLDVNDAVRKFREHDAFAERALAFATPTDDGWDAMSHRSTSSTTLDADSPRRFHPQAQQNVMLANNSHPVFGLPTAVMTMTSTGSFAGSLTNEFVEHRHRSTSTPRRDGPRKSKKVTAVQKAHSLVKEPTKQQRRQQLRTVNGKLVAPVPKAKSQGPRKVYNRKEITQGDFVWSYLYWGERMKPLEVNKLDWRRTLETTLMVDRFFYFRTVIDRATGRTYIALPDLQDVYEKRDNGNMQKQ